MGLAHITELPLVIINVQRGGPSTGLPTKTEQSDLMQAMYGRGGDARFAIVAASTPGDCFEVAYEACRIAVKYMTPVMLLSDGYLANGSEPWLIPDADSLNDFDVTFATGTNAEEDGKPVFHPYIRDEKTLARPWAKPGTAGLEHRIGGLEKQDGTGNVSYDSRNHENMTRIRAEKVERIQQEIPPLEIFGDPDADLIIVGWGSTRGAIEAGVTRALNEGHKAAAVHLRFVNPLPADLGEVLSRYSKYLVPELNNGQLVRILRDRFLLPFEAMNKVEGGPFGPCGIEGKIAEMVGLTPLGSSSCQRRIQKILERRSPRSRPVWAKSRRFHLELPRNQPCRQAQEKNQHCRQAQERSRPSHREPESVQLCRQAREKCLLERLQGLRVVTVPPSPRALTFPRIRTCAGVRAVVTTPSWRPFRG